jgi:hypothetical protein
MPTRVLLIVALVSVALASGSAAPRYSQWSTPTYFGAVNTTALEFANAISKDGLSFYFQRGDAAVNGEAVWVVGTVEMYFVSNPTGPQNNFVDVYRSFQNPDGSFGPPELVDELSDPLFNEGRPYIRHDGLEIFFQSNRVGSLGTDIWVSTRPTITAPWSILHRMEGDVNTIGNDVTPALSWDAQTLYFASTRTGPRGEIFFSTRQKVTGKPLP